MIKIWGTSFSLIGDLVISLPQLNYFKNKYKDIYVYFVIHKKISYCAPLFFNHPLIDKIHISGEWSSFDDNDYDLAKNCEILTTKLDHDSRKILNRVTDNNKFYYNSSSAIDANAAMSGIENLDEFINKDEKIPKLYKWFDTGFESIQKKGAYTFDKKVPNNHNYELSKSLSIWPFAGYGRSKNRNPSEEWWISLVKKLTNNGINVYHFGYFKEPKLSTDNKHYHNLTNLSFFEQIKISLGTKFSLGTDSGSMWVLGAYSHPTLVLLTNWNENHNSNFEALLPPNKSVKHIFCKNNFENLSIDLVYDKIISAGVSKINKVDKIFNFFK